jgi:hypothetical protein
LAASCASGQACIAQHCDNTGWKQGVTPSSGLNIKVGQFKSDASYITVPKGWRAVLKASNGQTHNVDGTTFNFCSRGGFNDAVVSITFSPLVDVKVVPIVVVKGTQKAAVKVAPKPTVAPKKAVVAPKSTVAPKKVVVAPKPTVAPKKAVVAPKSTVAPKKVVVAPKPTVAPKKAPVAPKAVAPKAVAPRVIVAPKVVAPKAVAPKVVAPKAPVAPKVVAPKAVAPKAVAPKVVAPKAPVAPKVVAPKAVAPKAAAPTRVNRGIPAKIIQKAKAIIRAPAKVFKKIRR